MRHSYTLLHSALSEIVSLVFFFSYRFSNIICNTSITLLQDISSHKIGLGLDKLKSLSKK